MTDIDDKLEALIEALKRREPDSEDLDELIRVVREAELIVARMAGERAKPDDHVLDVQSGTIGHVCD